MLDMISKRTCTFLYAFIASQPIPILVLVLDQPLGLITVSRTALFLFLAIPWGLAVVTMISALSELGLNTGRIWIKWALALSLVASVELYALKEVYLSYIIPINFIIFPLLALTLSHFFLKEQTR